MVLGALNSNRNIFFRVNNMGNKIGSHNFMLKTFSAKKPYTQCDPLVSKTGCPIWSVP